QGGLGSGPVLPESGEGKGSIVTAVDEVRLLYFPQLLPLIEAIGHNQSSTPLPGGSKRRLFRDGFRAGVDQAIANRYIFCPRWNQAPPHRHHFALLLVVPANDGDLLSRRDVEAQGKVRGGVESECLQQNRVGGS